MVNGNFSTLLSEWCKFLVMRRKNEDSRRASVVFSCEFVIIPRKLNELIYLAMHRWSNVVFNTLSSSEKYVIHIRSNQLNSKNSEQRMCHMVTHSSFSKPIYDQMLIFQNIPRAPTYMLMFIQLSIIQSEQWVSSYYHT